MLKTREKGMTESGTLKLRGVAKLPYRKRLALARWLRERAKDVQAGRLGPKEGWDGKCDFAPVVTSRCFLNEAR